MKRLQKLSGQLVAVSVEPCRASPPKGVTVEFYFDVTSPWTYMAFSRIREVCWRHGAKLVLKPFIVGGVFNVVNKDLYAMRDKMMAKAVDNNPAPKKRNPKEIYFEQNQTEWADYMGLDIKKLPERFKALTVKGLPGHPIKSVEMIRGCIVAMDDGKLEQYAFACFDAYWGTLRDTSDEAVVKQCCIEGGLSITPDQFWERIQDQDVKERLRMYTDEVIHRGGFGSPTIFINAEGFKERMFFGNDNMELIEANILRAQGKPWRFHDTYGIKRLEPQPQNQLQAGWAHVEERY